VDQPLKITCPSCGQMYEGRPSGHICPDGKTYHDRIANLSPLPRNHYRLTWEQEAELRRYSVKLTDEDKKMLKGMKILVD
jgi:hypothetical protein